MKLVAMNIPDDPTQLAGWLERHLTGPDLGRLAAELSAIHRDEAAGSVHEMLGGQLPDVLERGLSVLPPAALRSLLCHPRLLMDLQEIVLAEGGAYWDRFPASEELEHLAAAGLRQLRGHCTVAEPIPFRRGSWHWQPWAVSLATAASVVVVLYAVFPPRPPIPETSPPSFVASAASAWGWSKPDASLKGATAPEYLNRLADAAEEWFANRPEDAASLAHRVGEFRLACSTLLFAEHRPLPPEERRWLVERCRVWAKTFDRLLVALEADHPDVGTLRSDTDAAVQRIMANLRGRAKDLAGG